MHQLTVDLTSPEDRAALADWATSKFSPDASLLSIAQTFKSPDLANLVNLGRIFKAQSTMPTVDTFLDRANSTSFVPLGHGVTEFGTGISPMALRTYVDQYETRYQANNDGQTSAMPYVGAKIEEAALARLREGEENPEQITFPHNIHIQDLSQFATAQSREPSDLQTHFQTETTSVVFENVAIQGQEFTVNLFFDPISGHVEVALNAVGESGVAPVIARHYDMDATGTLKSQPKTAQDHRLPPEIQANQLELLEFTEDAIAYQIEQDMAAEEADQALSSILYNPLLIQLLQMKPQVASTEE